LALAGFFSLDGADVDLPAAVSCATGGLLCGQVSLRSGRIIRQGCFLPDRSEDRDLARLKTYDVGKTPWWVMAVRMAVQ
jgi:hypothetical protein